MTTTSNLAIANVVLNKSVLVYPRPHRHERRQTHTGARATARAPEVEPWLRFTAYKRSTLARRIDRRLAAINVGSYTDYVDYLEVHPDEFGQLFNAILNQRHLLLP